MLVFKKSRRFKTGESNLIRIKNDCLISSMLQKVHEEKDEKE